SSARSVVPSSGQTVTSESNCRPHCGHWSIILAAEGARFGTFGFYRKARGLRNRVRLRRMRKGGGKPPFLARQPAGVESYRSTPAGSQVGEGGLPPPSLPDGEGVP